MLYKTERKFHLIDIFVPGEKKIELKLIIKLRRKVKNIWNFFQVALVPIAIRALGVTLKRFKHCLKKLDVNNSIELFQKTALLGTAKIVRQVLET